MNHLQKLQPVYIEILVKGGTVPPSGHCSHAQKPVYFFAGLARTYLLYSCFLDMKNRSVGGISSGSFFLACI